MRREEMLQFKLRRLEEQGELCWRQRAHVNWMVGEIGTLISSM